LVFVLVLGVVWVDGWWGVDALLSDCRYWSCSMKVHAIFDIETLGLREELERGQLPEVVEIGLVFFDAETFEQLDSRIWYPEVGNGTMSYGTVAWWIKQILETGKAPAWYVWRAGGNTYLVDRVLDDIVVAFSNWKPVKVWGNDPEMDLTPIEEWFKCKGRNVPWKYYQRMDVRTVKDWAGVRPEKSATHDSVEDCVREVAILKMAAVKELPPLIDANGDANFSDGFNADMAGRDSERSADSLVGTKETE
jgi:hypothetical protein